MQIDNFIHLRVQSSYSMLESAMTIKDIVKLSKLYQMPAVGLADRGNLFGSLEFAIAARKEGIQPIHASILNLKTNFDDVELYSEILLIAKDELGYKNLLKLVSYSFIKNDRKICNHISFQDLEQDNEGLIVLSCYTKGIIGQLLLKNDQMGAKVAALKIQELFKDRFYFELWRHDLEPDRLIEEAYIALAAALNIPLVATNIVLFSKLSLHQSHDVLLCIASGVTMEHEDRLRVSEQCYFKTPKEMISLFADLPSAIKNSYNIAQRCAFMAKEHEPILPSFALDEEQTLRSESKEGLLKRLNKIFVRDSISTEEQSEIQAKYFERLEYELNIVCKMNFSGYFLIVSDFIKWSKSQNISVGPGRGSGAGSIIAWTLEITDLDPIDFGLLFERFLNPERISMPDFDIDFCQERREEVIEYVKSKYGSERVGQIITFGKLQAKAVIKDVSRVLGLRYEFANYLTELVPFNAVNPVTLEQAIREVNELKSAGSGKGLYNLKGEEDLIKQVLDTALILEGLHRHASVHAAGIVIAGTNLLDIVPVYKDVNSSMLITQYSMKYAEAAGLVKFDFLGLQTLTVITKTIELLKKSNIIIDFSLIPFDDAKTFAMLSTGSGVGVFQFESVGMKDTLRRLKPDNINDLIALGALYRPGPMENIPTYIACKHNKSQPDYLHPLLKNILEETYGVIIYQEQVLEIAKVLAGYSLGKADLLRRAMGKKIKSEMDAQSEIFIKGARANGIDEKSAKSIFNTVAKFAGYGFNKSHSSAYAVISYQTAYLKANYLRQFLVVCLNLDIGNSDKINIFIQEAKDNGIKVIPPCINKSKGQFDIDTAGDIIYAIGAIKGATVNLGEQIKEARAANGDFKSIIDFIERLPARSLNKKALENLIKAGGFDCIRPSRAELVENVQALLAYAASYHENQNSNQFSLIGITSSDEQILKITKQASLDILCAWEFEAIATYMINHPLKQYEAFLAAANVINSKDLKYNLSLGSNFIKIAGVIQKKEARMSGRGRFITIQLSDLTGIYELTIFSEEVLKDYVHLLDIKSVVVAYCDVNKDEGGVRVTAKSFHAIDSVIKGANAELSLRVQQKADLESMINLLKKNKEGKDNNLKVDVSVNLSLPVDSSFVAKVKFTENFKLSKEDLQILKDLDQTNKT